MVTSNDASRTVDQQSVRFDSSAVPLLRRVLPISQWSAYLVVQLLLVLTVIVVSQVGFYNEQAFIQELYGGSLDEQIGTNTLTSLGTVLSVILTLMVIAYPQRQIFTVTKIFLFYQSAVAISGLMSSTPFLNSYYTIKNVIYLLALERLIRYLPVRKVVSSIAFCVVAILLWSMYLGYADPIYRVSIGATGLRGLFPHKNGLGAFAVFFLCFVAPFALFSSRRAFFVLAAIIAIVATIASSSRTAQICLGFGLLCGLIAYAGGRNVRPSARISFVLVIGATLATVVAPVLGYLIYTGAVTFTGRTIFWSSVLDMVSDRMFLGFGAGTIPLNTDIVNAVALQSGFTAFDGSLILILFNQGVVGLLAFGATLYALCRLAIRKNNVLSPFVVATTLIYLLHGLSESSSQFGLNTTTFFLFTLAILCERMSTNDYPVLIRTPQSIVRHRAITLT